MTTPQSGDQADSLQQKRDALRDAVVNPALPHPPGESLRQMFQAWIDRFTVWHLRILSLLDDPKGWFAARDRPFPTFMTSSLGSVLVEAFPELKDQRTFYDLLAKDLWNNGLVNTDGLHAMMSASGAGASRTTDIGKEFLRFVTAPKPGQ